jgi:SAM-dependent methyltransferase
MIDFHKIVQEFQGRISWPDCGERCSGKHKCCPPNQIHPLLPGEGPFMSDHGFDVRFNYDTGDDCWVCPGKDQCAGLLRPIVCRTYPIYPSVKGLMIDLECSEAPWISWTFINEMERMWRYLFSADERVMLWAAKYERLVWSKKPSIPLYEINLKCDVDYSDRFQQWFDSDYIQDVVNCGWIRPGDKVLDVGGGKGDRLPFLRKAGVDCTVLDINPKLAEIAGGICGDARNIPFDDNSFDVVFSYDVLEHIPDPGAAVREMARVSRDRLVLHVTTMIDMGNLMQDPTHKVFLPFSEWLRLFNEVADIELVDYAYTGALLRKRKE